MLLVGHSVFGGFKCCVLFTAMNVTMVTQTRLATMVVSHPCPPLLIPLLLPECVLELPTTRAESRASQVPSALANDSLTAVRHTRPVQRQNCREHVRFFRNMLVYLLSFCPTTHTNCLRYEPTASYAVCCKFSRCSTGEGNQCAHRGSPQPRYNFDEGNTRLVRRSSVIVRVRRREPTLTAPFPSAAA